MRLSSYQHALDDGWPAVQAKVDAALKEHAEGLRQAVTIKRVDTIMVDRGTRLTLPHVGPASASRRGAEIMPTLVVSADVRCYREGPPQEVYDPETWVTQVEDAAVTLVASLADVEDALLKRQVGWDPASATGFRTLLESAEPRHLAVSQSLCAQDRKWVEELQESSLLLTWSTRPGKEAWSHLWIHPEQAELWVNADWSLSREVVREEHHEPGHASAGRHKAYVVTLELEATMGARVNPVGSRPELHIGPFPPRRCRGSHCRCSPC